MGGIGYYITNYITNKAVLTSSSRGSHLKDCGLFKLFLSFIKRVRAATDSFYSILYNEAYMLSVEDDSASLPGTLQALRAEAKVFQLVLMALL